MVCPSCLIAEEDNNTCVMMEVLRSTVTFSSVDISLDTLFSSRWVHKPHVITFTALVALG